MPTNNMSSKKIKVLVGSKPMQRQAVTSSNWRNLKHSPESRRSCVQGKCIHWSKKHKEKKYPKWQHRILDQLISLTWHDMAHYQQAFLKSQCTMGIFCNYTSPLNNQPVMNRIEVGISFAAEATKDL